MLLDAVAGTPAGFRGDGLHAAVADPGAATATGADDVVVVLAERRADDVGVLAGGQVEPLEGVEVGEQVECTEERRPPDAHATGTHVVQKLSGGEVSLPFADQLGNGTPRLGQAMAGPLQDGQQEWLSAPVMRRG